MLLYLCHHFRQKMDVGTEDSMLNIMSVRSSGLDCISPITRLYLSSVCLLYFRQMVSSTTVNHDHLLTVRGQSNGLGIYCQVTIWPGIYKKHTSCYNSTLITSLIRELDRNLM